MTVYHLSPGSLHDLLTGGGPTWAMSQGLATRLSMVRYSPPRPGPSQVAERLFTEVFFFFFYLKTLLLHLAAADGFCLSASPKSWLFWEILTSL